MQDKKILVALDYDDSNEALAFVDRIDPALCRLKVGKEMFTLFGPEFVKTLHHKGFEVFLDLKFHDIPNTVAKAVAAAAKLGVWMVNVHASGGKPMMQAARKALDNFEHPPLLIAVTVLTSMDQQQLSELAIERTPEEQVLFLAQLAKESGMDGVVCSAQEATALKQLCGNDFMLVTPGIRPAGADAGDQKRIMTPEQAVAAGSDYLVIGRPITQADDPISVLKAINSTI